MGVVGAEPLRGRRGIAPNRETAEIQTMDFPQPAGTIFPQAGVRGQSPYPRNRRNTNHGFSPCIADGGEGAEPPAEPPSSNRCGSDTMQSKIII